MTQTETTGRRRFTKRRRYRRVMWGFVFGGVAIGLALRSLGYPFIGEAVYWIGAIGFLAVWRGTSLTLFDERDKALEQRAATTTLALSAPIFVVGASAARILTWTDIYTVPTVVWGALYGYVALFATFGVVVTWLRYRR